MILRYNNYLFDPNATQIATSIQTLMNRGGQPYAQRKTFSVTGFLAADGQALLTLASNLLATALAVPYKDLVLLQDDGTFSATILPNAGSITGVVVSEVSFPGELGDYATNRKFTFQASAEYPLPNSVLLLLDFEESLAFSGGGPIYGHKLAINGPPQKQLIYPQSIYAVTQSGRATGYRAYPAPPAPKWPNDLKETPNVSSSSPERKGNGYQGYGVQWSYKFESAAPLVGVPSLWVN